MTRYFVGQGIWTNTGKIDPLWFDIVVRREGLQPSQPANLFHPTVEDGRIGGHAIVGVTENIGVIEAALTPQPFGVYRQPAAIAKIQHVVMMNITVQYAFLPRAGKQFGRGGGAEAQRRSMPPWACAAGHNESNH